MGRQNSQYHTLINILTNLHTRRGFNGKLYEETNAGTSRYIAN